MIGAGPGSEGGQEWCENCGDWVGVDIFEGSSECKICGTPTEDLMSKWRKKQSEQSETQIIEHGPEAGAYKSTPSARSRAFSRQ
jgi:hypothetical protein